MLKRDLYSRSVFINCPFSADYQPIFRAILFSVYYCSCRPRCALEVSDSTQMNSPKIEGIIQECRLGIHDISFVNIDPKTKVSRFNMPFELGMFFAAKRFGSYKQKRKIALVFDTHAYRYRNHYRTSLGKTSKFTKEVQKQRYGKSETGLTPVSGSQFRYPAAISLPSSITNFRDNCPML